MRLIQVLVIYLVIFQTINDNLMVDLFGENVLKFTLIGFILVFVKRFFTFKYLTKFNILIMLFVLASMISIIVNFPQLNDPISSIAAIIAIISYFIIFSQEPKLNHIYIAIIISLIISSFYCILRPETISEWTFRKTGGTGDPNEFSTMILIGISIIWGYYIKYRKFLNVVLPLTLLFLSSLLLAGSKSAFFALAILACIISFHLLKRASVIGKFKVLITLSICGLLLIISIQNLFGETLDLFLVRFDNNGTANERLKSWEAGIAIFEDNYFFGVGPLNYGETVGNRFLASIAEGSREAHNLFLKALTETGVFGFIPFLFIIYLALKSGIKGVKNELNLFITLSIVMMGLTLSLTFEKYTWLVLALVFNPYISNSNYFEKKKDC